MRSIEDSSGLKKLIKGRIIRDRGLETGWHLLADSSCPPNCFIAALSYVPCGGYDQSSKTFNTLCPWAYLLSVLLWQAGLMLVFSRENTVQPTFGLHAYTKLPLPYISPGLLFLHQPVLRIPPSGCKELREGCWYNSDKQCGTLGYLLFQLACDLWTSS